MTEFKPGDKVRHPAHNGVLTVFEVQPDGVVKTWWTRHPLATDWTVQNYYGLFTAMASELTPDQPAPYPTPAVISEDPQPAP